MNKQDSIIIPELVTHEYNGCSFVQKKSDGYVNLTDMVKLSNKSLADWKRLNMTRDYINEISVSMGIIPSRIMYSEGKGCKTITWGHPLLALELARWISFKFSLWMNCHVLGQYYQDNDNSYTKDKSGFVYLVVQEGSSKYKIGVSKDVYKRVQRLQISSPIPLIVVERVFSVNCLYLEKALHEYYDAYRIRTEWFELSTEQVKSFLSIANKLDKDLDENIISIPSLRN